MRRTSTDYPRLFVVSVIIHGCFRPDLACFDSEILPRASKLLSFFAHRMCPGYAKPVAMSMPTSMMSLCRTSRMANVPAYDCKPYVLDRIRNGLRITILPFTFAQESYHHKHAPGEHQTSATSINRHKNCSVQ
jgi:hypothetical protein